MDRSPVFPNPSNALTDLITYGSSVSSAEGGAEGQETKEQGLQHQQGHAHNGSVDHEEHATHISSPWERA